MYVKQYFAAPQGSIETIIFIMKVKKNNFRQIHVDPKAFIETLKCMSVRII